MRPAPTILMLVVCLGCSAEQDGMLTLDCLLQAGKPPRTKTPMTR
jgi:hypothetical protein